MGKYTIHDFRQMLSGTFLSERSSHRFSEFYGTGSHGQDLQRMLGIINSMTSLELTRPEIIDRKRTERIAVGSGTSPSDVTELLRQFANVKPMMEEIDRLKKRFPT